MTDTTWFKRLNWSCWKNRTGKTVTEEGGLWQSVWGMAGFSHSLLAPLLIPSITSRNRIL